jgi:hypothetical protein
MTRSERKAIEKAVYDKFPFSKAELRCRNEKRIMDGLRDTYRKKLIAQTKEKMEYK